MPFRRSLTPLVLALAFLGAPAACGGEDDGAPPAGESPPPSAAERTPQARERPDENAGGAGDEGRTGEDEGGSATPGSGGSERNPGGSDSAGGGRGGSYDPERPDSPANDVPPPRGSPAERFERFCAQNPRECY